MIELLVVVLIVGILAAVAIPQYYKVVERSRVAVAKSKLDAIATAQEVYLVKYGKYTDNWDNLEVEFIKANGSKCSGTATGLNCIVGDYDYCFALSSPYFILAQRQDANNPYGKYTLIYKPNEPITCDRPDCTKDLLD